MHAKKVGQKWLMKLPPGGFVLPFISLVLHCLQHFVGIFVKFVFDPISLFVCLSLSLSIVVVFVCHVTKQHTKGA